MPPSSGVFFAAPAMDTVPNCPPLTPAFLVEEESPVTRRPYLDCLFVWSHSEQENFSVRFPDAPRNIKAKAWVSGASAWASTSGEIDPL